jgi:hypothetical protein
MSNSSTPRFTTWGLTWVCYKWNTKYAWETVRSESKIYYTINKFHNR